MATVFIVAPFWGRMGNQFDALTTSFSNVYDWAAIKSHCDRLAILQSNTDPYITEAKSRELAKKLSIDVTMVQGAGHFNESAGFKVFPLLRDLIIQDTTS